MIRAGRVRLNGKVRRDPETPVQSRQDQIEVDGQNIGARERIYLVMNKPRGLVTTASDEKGRDTVYSLLEKLPWLSPIGRLDKASEGLLLLTNDSEWGARIAAPETHLPKTYRVQIGTIEGERAADALTRGVKDEEGELLRAVSANVLRLGAKNCWLEVVLDEGKNRQIRRMLASLEMEVLRLIRIAIGPLQLGQLAKGSFRSMTAAEKLALDRALNLRPAKTKS